MKRTRTVPLAPIRLRAELEPSNTKPRRAQAVIYAGAEMDRFDPFGDGHYTLRLAMDGADLSRFNAGAAVTRNHSSDLDDQVGVTERAWISDGAAHATLRLSDGEHVAQLWADIQSGVIRNVSMDVALVELEDVTKRGGKKALVARKWQPIGLAIVPAGADPGAQMMAMSAGAEQRPCVFKGGQTMRKLKRCPSCKAQLKHEPDVELTECPECEVDLAEAEAQRDELVRIGHAHRLAEQCELGETWAQRWIKDGLSREEMRDAALEERVRRQPVIDGNHYSMHLEWESPAFRFDAMAEGLAARASGKEPTERARPYYRTTLVELAHAALTANGRVEHRMLDPRYHATRIIDVALMHTTSDYQIILGNAVNRMLQPEYEQAPATYRSVCAKRDFRDFRPHSFVRLGDFPDLKEVGEAGEITQGTISESGETVTGANYSRIYSISRRALVNDDVGAFNDLVMKAARRVAGFENALFFTILQLNSGNGPTMGDSVALFNAAHGNTGTGVIDVTNVGAGVAKMLRQTGLDGVKLNAEPAALVVSPDRVAVARQFVTQNLRPTQPSEANPFANLTALADAELVSAAPWYLFAAGVNSAFVYGFVDGANGPRIDTRAGWEVEGLQIRCCLDFAVGAIDWRGAYRSTGS